MSQSATGRALDPASSVTRSGISVWKIALGIVLGFVGIVALVLGVAAYQIVSDSVKEVRSAGPDGTETVHGNTMCAASVEELLSGRGSGVRLYTGDTVKPRMASGSFANVIPVSGAASGSMPNGCWMERNLLQ